MSMKNCIYLDVLFLRIFFMNLLCIISYGMLFSKTIKWKNVLLAVLAGTTGNLVVFFFGVNVCGLSVLFAWLMCFFAYGKGKIKLEKEGPLFLIFIAMCMEGSIRWIGTFHGVWIVPLICRLIGREKQRKEQEMEVILSFKGRQKRLMGFYDSGNRLMEPLTGKMVHIANYEDVAELLPECYRQEVEAYFNTGVLNSTKVTELQMYEFTFLSYHSIGKENGQLLGIRMDSAQFIGCAGKKTEDRVIIGLTKQRLFVRGQDRIIVNGRMEL